MSESLYNFGNKGRLPVVPLSYEFSDLAKVRELIADYETGDVYIKTTSGELVNICTSTTTMQKFIDYIYDNPDVVSNLTITTPDGNSDTLENVLNNLHTNIKALNNKTYSYAGSESNGGPANTANKLRHSLHIQYFLADGITPFTSEFNGSEYRKIDLTKYYDKNKGGEIEGDVALEGNLILSENVMYGTELPAKGTEGQLFFLIVD